MAAAAKPLFPLAGSFTVVFTARIADRIGKGIRGAPRDALVADLVPQEMRGASYGLRQSLDTIGAFSGPLAATVLMLMSGGNFRLVFWLAVVPAIASVAILFFLVPEPSKSSNGGIERPKPKIHWNDIQFFPSTFWWIVAIGAVFTLARFSEAFLVLRASDLGLNSAYVPLVMVEMNVVYAISAYPAGLLSDRIDRRFILAAGAAMLLIADVTLANATSAPSLFLGTALWGLHMGFTQGLFAALVADASPVEQRGTGFGIFSLASGIAVLAASVLAGGLWDRIGPSATFYAGAAFASLSLLGLLIYIKKSPFASSSSLTKSSA
jgi:MFS family permease